MDLSKVLVGASGAGYAHEYDAWLALFKFLACTEDSYMLFNVPSSWCPFLAYLGHRVRTVQMVAAWECERFDWLGEFERAVDRRRVVEIASTCRPELVHALYCLDTEWKKGSTAHELQPGFPVTCNGSFFRPEVQHYQNLLNRYVPNGHDKCVLVPCSAEKPYPSGLHMKVMSVLPDSTWHVVVATGVLGLVPQELFEDMPMYDSGLPNLERVTATVRWYFSRHEYERVICYSDFYAVAIRRGLEGAGIDADYVLGSHYRDTYENLLLPEHLYRLEEAIGK